MGEGGGTGENFGEYMDSYNDIEKLGKASKLFFGYNQRYNDLNDRRIKFCSQMLNVLHKKNPNQRDLNEARALYEGWYEFSFDIYELGLRTKEESKLYDCWINKGLIKNLNKKIKQYKKDFIMGDELIDEQIKDFEKEVFGIKKKENKKDNGPIIIIKIGNIDDVFKKHEI